MHKVSLSYVSAVIQGRKEITGSEGTDEQTARRHSDDGMRRRETVALRLEAWTRVYHPFSEQGLLYESSHALISILLKSSYLTETRGCCPSAARGNGVQVCVAGES